MRFVCIDCGEEATTEVVVGPGPDYHCNRCQWFEREYARREKEERAQRNREQRARRIAKRREKIEAMKISSDKLPPPDPRVWGSQMRAKDLREMMAPAQWPDPEPGCLFDSYEDTYHENA